MDIFSYVAHQNPQEALDLLGNYSRVKPRNKQGLAEDLKKIYKNLRIDGEKEEFLFKLGEIHPDKEIIQVNDIVTSDYNDNYKGHVSCNCPMCRSKEIMHHEVIGSMVGANGQQAVSHYMNSGAVQSQIGDPTILAEINNLKTESTVQKTFNDKLFKFVVITAIIALGWKLMNKQ